MPYYYFVSEVSDITSDEPIRGWTKLYKPETYNLLLPSIHASRSHNILLSEDNSPKEAVSSLLTACADSSCWPSSFYDNNQQGVILDNVDSNNVIEDPKNVQTKRTCNAEKQVESPPVLTRAVSQPVFAKYRPPCWSQDISDPNVINAARSLFFERKKQQSVYECNNPTWNYSATTLRMPTDYELFVAWASLPRAEKMKYISEVTGICSTSPSQLPVNPLETERAVNFLYSHCPDAPSWPSFEYLQLLRCPYPPSLRVAIPPTPTMPNRRYL